MKRFLTCAAIGVVGLTVVSTLAFAGGRGHGHGHHRGGFHHGGGWGAPCWVPVMPSCPTQAAPEPVASWQTQRYLQVKNDTGEKLTVYVQYRTFTDKGTWRWYPAKSEEALAYELDPGETTCLADEGWQIRASRVRIWAVAGESGHTWDQYEKEDLWLVPETFRGIQCYEAEEMETFTFTFPAAEGN
jgi:hypothetical protein